MLVLTRKVGETLIIGEGENEIRIKITRTVGSRVTLGIEAPKHIPIDREEIRQRKNTN